MLSQKLLQLAALYRKRWLKFDCVFELPKNKTTKRIHKKHLSKMRQCEVATAELVDLAQAENVPDIRHIEINRESQVR